VAWSIAAFTRPWQEGLCYWFTFIEPATMFDVVVVVKLFVILLLGGSGTVMVPLWRFYLRGDLRDRVEPVLESPSRILGVLIIFIIFFIPMV